MLYRISMFLLICTLILLQSCAAPEKQFSYSDISGEEVKRKTIDFLKSNHFTIQEQDFHDYNIFAKSPQRVVRPWLGLGSESLEWDEITIIAREYNATPVTVDLLIQVQIWRQPPIGEKELIKNVSNKRRLEGEAKLLELNKIILDTVD